MSMEKKEKKEFTKNGVIIVTDGSYIDRLFIIDSVNHNPHSTFEGFITFKCTHMQTGQKGFSFDNLCARQIGTINRFRDDYMSWKIYKDEAAEIFGEQEVSFYNYFDGVFNYIHNHTFKVKGRTRENSVMHSTMSVDEFKSEVDDFECYVHKMIDLRQTNLQIVK